MPDFSGKVSTPVGSEPATRSPPAAGPHRRSTGLRAMVTTLSGARVTSDRCDEAFQASGAAARFSFFLSSSALLRFRCRAVIRVRSVMRKHLLQAHLRKGQSFMWPFCGTTIPWCRHRVHFGCRGTSAAAPSRVSFSLDRDMIKIPSPCMTTTIYFVVPQMSVCKPKIPTDLHTTLYKMYHCE